MSGTAILFAIFKIQAKSPTTFLSVWACPSFIHSFIHGHSHTIIYPSQLFSAVITNRYSFSEFNKGDFCFNFSEIYQKKKTLKSLS